MSIFLSCGHLISRSKSVTFLEIFPFVLGDFVNPLGSTAISPILKHIKAPNARKTIDHNTFRFFWFRSITTFLKLLQDIFRDFYLGYYFF